MSMGRAQGEQAARPMVLRVADWLYLGTLWGATARTIGVFFLMPIAADMALGNATAVGIVRYAKIALYCLVLLDVVGWAIRTGQIRIHTGWAPKARTAAEPIFMRPVEETACLATDETEEMASARQTLGVGRSATQDQIRSAWLREAKRNHPDRNPGDAHAERQFIAARDAYALLKD